MITPLELKNWLIKKDKIAEDARTPQEKGQRHLPPVNSRPVVEFKKCKICGEVKPADAFCRSTYSRGGLHAACRECQNAARRVIYHQEKERRAQRKAK